MVGTALEDKVLLIHQLSKARLSRKQLGLSKTASKDLMNGPPFELLDKDTLRLDVGQLALLLQAQQQQMPQQMGYKNSADALHQHADNPRSRRKRKRRDEPVGAITWVPGGVFDGNAHSAAASSADEAGPGTSAASPAAAAAAAHAAVDGSWGAAHKLMAKMGYQPGQGLGKSKQGLKQPLEPASNAAKRGLGFARAAKTRSVSMPGCPKIAFKNEVAP
eukprot:gene9850-10009_t